MDRRVFLSSSLSLISTLPFISFKNSNTETDQWILAWIKFHDEQFPNYDKNRITEAQSKYLGAYVDADAIPNVHSTASFINRGCMLISLKDSKFYQNQNLLKSLEKSTIALLKFQHEDGTIDLVSTNFHSTPDVAFVLENILPAYNYLNSSSIIGKEKTLLNLKSFIKSSAEALIVGGIHTPNHRWVVSAALCKIHEIFPDERLVKRAEQWLAEHIDQDPDGQYTEKSTHVYSPIVNRALIDIARVLKHESLYENVRKNLSMTLYYIHPNNEVVTEGSNRQDKGIIGNMMVYYANYRYMAIKDQNGDFAAVCEMIEKNNPLTALAGFLPNFLENPLLKNALPEFNKLPTSYVKSFPYSGLVRIRRNNWDCTILQKNTSFLTFHNGNAVLQAMRLSSSFFGKGQFESEKIEHLENTWVLSKALEGPYYQPFSKEQISTDGDFEKMPRNLRKQSEVQTLKSTVYIKEVEGGLEVSIEVIGTENVPLTLELIFRPGGELSGVDPHPKNGKSFMLSGPLGTYKVGGDSIKFGPGLALHKGIQLRGALPALDAPSVYLTGFTPFRHVLNIVS